MTMPDNVTLQEQPKISLKNLAGHMSSFHNLKDTFNPRDMLRDAIHNFHPTCGKYTEQRNHPADYTPAPPIPPIPSNNLTVGNNSAENNQDLPSTPDRLIQSENFVLAQKIKVRPFSLIQHFGSKPIPYKTNLLDFAAGFRFTYNTSEIMAVLLKQESPKR
ncbi:hypothetical protein ACTXT7_016123 [Hymenolepis weldensis]